LVWLMASETGAEAFIGQQQAIIGRPDSRPDLARIDCPTLVLVGDSDQLTPPELGGDQLARLQEQATEKLATIRAKVDALKEAMRIDAGDLQLPAPVVPAAELNGHRPGMPLVDSSWPFAEQCRRLLDSKGYRQQGGDA
jgi:hypothetical protein